MSSLKFFFMSYLLRPISYVAIFLLTLFILNQFTYFNFSLGSSNTYNSFEAIGTGKVSAVPNTALTTFTIEEKGATQETARAAANSKQNQALSALSKIGIDKSGIKTTGFYVNPNYENEVQPLTGGAEPAIFPPATRKQNGYIAVVTTEVKADDIQKLNRAIDELTSLGLNVSGVSYVQADREKYVLEAQNKAIENAKVQANDWAKAAGVKLGKIITIRNADDSGYPQPYADASLKAAPESSSTNLQPGENEITARMGVTFEIKN